MIYYQDDLIKIREAMPHDVVPMFACRIDREVNRFDPRPVPQNSYELLTESKRFVNFFETKVLTKEFYYFIITTVNDEFIGYIDLYSIDPIKKEGEMGVIIGDKRYWNQGLATKALSEIIDNIFQSMDINRIYIETGETNIPAQKLFTKLNFNRCGDYTEPNGFKFIVMERFK